MVDGLGSGCTRSPRDVEHRDVRTSELRVVYRVVRAPSFPTLVNDQIDVLQC